MPRADFQRSLEALQDDVLTLGNMVEKALFKAVDALARRDLTASQEVIEGDTVIDQKRYQLEEACIGLIAREQPVARDLRNIVAILYITDELERMGDYAEGIAKISLMMGEQPPLKPLIDIPRMAEMGVDMMRRSLQAFVKGDAEAAVRVCQDDDRVDALYDQVYRELLTYMLQDPRTIDRATWLLWTAHNLERFADRATNLAERVIFLVTGRLGDYASKY